jgi:methyl-accepting chemotaxis protein
VVADEVRKLAERTSSATKEIASKIQGVQNETRLAVVAMEAGTKQVEEGVQTTNQAGEALKAIIQNSEQVGDQVMHIASAATQQSAATDQINSSMGQIADLMKESATAARQSAEACNELSELAISLQRIVAAFKLRERSDGGHDAGLSRTKATQVQSYKPLARAASSRS